MKKIYSYSLSAAFVAALLSVSSVANAQDNNAAVTAEASQDAAVATFDDLTLESESSWWGPADNAEEVAGAYGTEWVGTFKSGSYEFVNSVNPDWGSWMGCSYSNMTATSFESYEKDQWNSAAGHGANGSANYGVLYGNSLPNTPMEVIKVLNGGAEGRIIAGMNITNSAWVVECVKNGNGAAKKFEKGSWFKVIFTGTKADESTVSVEYYLADYRSENEADWTCLTDWAWLDLSSLGKVVSLSISFDGTDKSYGYLNTSTYVCIDNVGCEKNVSTGIAANKWNSVELREVARFSADGKRISAPQKGLNIIRMSDGSTRKVVVK